MQEENISAIPMVKAVVSFVFMWMNKREIIAVFCGENTRQSVSDKKLQRQLVVRNIQPMAELVANLGEVGDFAEAEFFMECAAGGVVIRNAGNEGMATGGSAFCNEALHKGGTNATAFCMWGKVDGGFPCVGIGGTLFPRMGVAVA